MQFEKLLETIKKSTGIVFSNNQDIITRKIIRFYEEKGYQHFVSFEEELRTNKDLYQELINLITTSETYFYREFLQIELCVQKVKEINSNVKILSAPCASGEEPYSILFALIEAGVSLNKIEIHAIDINSKEIQNAKKAIFKQRRLHKLSNELQDKYFTKLEKDQYQIKEQYQKQIHFSQANIFEPLASNMNDFDIIFSRNMLIYFDEEAKSKVEKIFYDKLKNGGYLFLGHADHIKNSSGFTKKVLKGTTYYQK